MNAQEWYDPDTEAEELVWREAHSFKSTPAQEAWCEANPQWVEGTPEYVARQLQFEAEQVELNREADARRAAVAKCADAARADLEKDLRLAHSDAEHERVLEDAELLRSTPYYRYVLTTHKWDLDSRSLTQKEREYLSKYVAKILLAAPIYAKELELQVIHQCGHARQIQATKSDVRHRRWISMIEDVCRSLCADCTTAKFEADAPIRAAAQQNAADFTALRTETLNVLKTGEAKSLLDAVELISGDPQTRLEIYRATVGWWRQEQVNCISTTSGRERIAAIDANINQGYQLLQLRVHSHWLNPEYGHPR